VQVIDTVSSPNHAYFASPRAKLAAKKHNINLSLLTGSGCKGAIIEKDVYSAVDEYRASGTGIGRNGMNSSYSAEESGEFSEDIKKIYDVIIIGAGPGGYTAAEKLGKAGMSVALVEKGELGGTCLNAGCIPTKTLLNAARLLTLPEKPGKIGINLSASLNPASLYNWKGEVIAKLRSGVRALLKSARVTIINGKARFASDKVIAVGEESIGGRHIIIAVGSEPVLPPIPGINGPNVLTSTDALELDEIPKRLIIIGGGVIGVEFASLYSALGCKVTVVEAMEEILPLADAEFAAMMRAQLKKVDFMLSSTVIGISPDSVAIVQNGKKVNVQCEKVIVCVGRKPSFYDLGLENTMIAYDKDGIKVDSMMRTNVRGVFAIGDVTGKSNLAHAASRMAYVASGTILGRRQFMRYKAIPWVVYTPVELAGAGMTEKQAKERGITVKTAKASAAANGRYVAENPDINGFCKIITDAETGVLLGVEAFGAGCSEIIASAVIMIELELTVSEMLELIFPHPTFSEIIIQAADRL
jgi:dihydrolipoamide dehydrogenase